MTKDAQAHLSAAQLVARQLAIKVTPARVAAWAYHIKMMLSKAANA